MRIDQLCYHNFSKHIFSMGDEDSMEEWLWLPK